MRKITITITLTLLCGSFTAFSQSETFKPFKVDLGLLAAVPTGRVVGSGFGFYLEPKYAISDAISLGLRAERVIFGPGEKYRGGTSSVTVVGSYTVTGDYYFTTSKIRPFAGVALGIYTLGKLDANVGCAGGITADESRSLGTKFGFAPRVGVSLGHARLALAYNVILDQPKNFSKSYLAFKLGVEFGGGRH